MNRVALIAAVLLAGCAPQPARQVPPVQHYEPARCSGAVACGQMWSRAMTFVEMASGMKVMSANETLIQTYPANALGRMTGVVTKYPLSETDYEIRLSLSCVRHDRCEDLAANGINLFNMSVAGPPGISRPGP